MREVERWDWRWSGEGLEEARWVGSGVGTSGISADGAAEALFSQSLL